MDRTLTSYRGQSRLLSMGVFLILLGVFLFAALTVPLGTSRAYAAVAPANTITNLRYVGRAASDSVTTYSSTTYADVTGLTVAYPISGSDPTYTGEVLQACWSAAVSKATAGTGTVGLYVNGAISANSERSFSSTGGAESVGGCFIFTPLSTLWKTGQTIKLQAKSSDANAASVGPVNLHIFRLN